VDSVVPIQVPAISGATAIAAGNTHSVALVNGHVWTWGFNNYGQLGNGLTANSHSPGQITGIDQVMLIGAGYDYTMAVRDDGYVWGWGFNGYGQLGDNTPTQKETPVQTLGVGGEGYLNLLGTDSYTYYLPYYYQYGENYTNIALRNLATGSAASVIVTARDQNGTVIADGSLASISIPARGQMAAVMPASSLPGWIEVVSDLPLAGMCFVGVGKGIPYRLWTMADISLQSTLSVKLVVPHVAEDATWDTAVFLCNPQTTSTSVVLTFVDESGNAMYSMTVSMAARGSGVYFLSDLLPPGVLYSRGSVEISASQGVAGFAIFYDTVKNSGSCFAGISTVPMQ
jgi:hypothetical protein